MVTTAFREDWPACFRCCGILSDGVIINANAVDWHDPSPDLDAPDLSVDAPLETLEEGKVVIYTDGACICNQRPSLRRAGVGIWWGNGHAKNYSAPLPGQVQTNQRAELAAVIFALRNEERPLRIKSDSAYVVKGCNKFIHAWSSLHCHGVKNEDL